MADVGQVPTERPDLGSEPVDLDPGAVQLPFHRGGPDPPEGFLDVLCRLGQHWLEGSQELESECAQATAPLRHGPPRPPPPDDRREWGLFNRPSRGPPRPGPPPLPSPPPAPPGAARPS